MSFFSRYASAFLFSLFSLKILVSKSPSLVDSILLFVLFLAFSLKEYISHRDKEKYINSAIEKQNEVIKNLENKIDELKDVKNYLTSIKMANSTRGQHGSR